MLNSTLHPKTYCPKEDQTCTKLRDKDAAHFFEEEHDLIEEYENEVTFQEASNFNPKIIKKFDLRIQIMTGMNTIMVTTMMNDVYL